MNWLAVAASGYFLNAIVFSIDKYLLHSRIPKPSVYAFYVAIFSSFGLLLAPFGASLIPIRLVALSFLSGFLFIYGLVSLYTAIKKNEISRVVPLVGVIIPLVSLFFSFIFLGERFNFLGWLSIILLVSGGFLISFDLPLKKKRFLAGIRFVILTGILHAASFAILKVVFNEAGFVNGFAWTRLAFFCAGLSLFLVPSFRKNITDSLRGKGRKKRQIAATGMIFVFNKSIAGAGKFLLDFSMSLGSVTLVLAIGGIQYAFVLAVAAILSIKMGFIYREKMNAGDWFQRIAAISIIGTGLAILAFSNQDVIFLTS